MFIASTRDRCRHSHQNRLPRAATLAPRWLALLAIAFASTALGQAVGWRGDGSGRFPDAEPPQTWSQDSHIVWSAKLPGRAYASPVLSKDRLFVLAESTHVICLNAADGQTLWQATADYAAALGDAKAAEIERTYADLAQEKRALKKPYDQLRKSDPDSEQVERLREQMREIDRRRKEFERSFPQQRRGGAGNAAATPVCNGEQLFVVLGTGIVAAYAYDGRRLWIRHLEGPAQGFGHSASPVLAGGKLIVHLQDLVALDPDTGREVWRNELPAKFGTCVAQRIGEEDVLITPGGALVRAADGRVLAEKLFQLSNNSPVAHDGVIYAHESGKAKAYRLPQSLSEPVELELLWESSSTRDQRMASAVYCDGMLFAAGRRGVMDVIDAQTGKVLYRKRLDLGDIFSSVTLAGNLIYVSGRKGTTLVLRPDREYREVAENRIERFSTNPIFAGKRMYLRAEKRLYCIGE